MDQVYKPLYKQAMDLQYKFHDVLDDHSHPQSRFLQNEVRQLTQDIESNKNPRAVENRVKIIQQSMMQAQHQGLNIMNSDHANYFHESYDHMRNNIRQMPHY